MFYAYTLEVPPSTLKTAPVVTTMYLTAGIVHQVELSFPPGCAALVHAVIYHFEHQVWPTNPEGDFAWDDYTIVLPRQEYRMASPPYDLSLRAWSEDDFFLHTLTCRLAVKIPEPHRPGSWLNRLIKGETGA